MLCELTYLILEIVAITALALVALQVLAAHPKRLNAWLLAGVFLSSACYLLNRMAFKGDERYQLDLGLLLHPVQIGMNLGRRAVDALLLFGCSRIGARFRGCCWRCSGCRWR